MESVTEPPRSGGGETGRFSVHPCAPRSQSILGSLGRPSTAAELLQGRQGRRTVPFGRWQKLPQGRRKAGSAVKPETESIFAELEKGRSVLFCLEAADLFNIPVLSDRFVGHTPSRTQNELCGPMPQKKRT